MPEADVWFACNHGQWEFGCPAGCHTDVKRLGRAAAAVLQFERDEHSLRVRASLDAQQGMDYWATLGPDVAELIKYNREPSFLAGSVRG